jgi:hypothetical protein
MGHQFAGRMFEHIYTVQIHLCKSHENCVLSSFKVDHRPSLRVKEKSVRAVFSIIFLKFRLFSKVILISFSTRFEKAISKKTFLNLDLYRRKQNVKYAILKY